MRLLYKFTGIILVMFLVTGCGSTTKGLDDQPKNNSQQFADYNVQLGVGYMRQGDMPRAKQKLLTALDKAPSWPPALEAMAYFYQMTGDSAKAQNYYLKALNIAPHAGATLNNYGGFLCLQGKYRESLTYFDRAAADESYLKTAAVNENAGLCAAKIPDYKLAEQYLQKALRQNPARLAPLIDLADMAEQQGEYKVALDYLNLYAQQADLDARHEKLRSTLMQKLPTRDLR